MKDIYEDLTDKSIVELSDKAVSLIEAEHNGPFPALIPSFNRGFYLVPLDHQVIARLKSLANHSESISDTIIRIFTHQKKKRTLQ